MEGVSVLVGYILFPAAILAGCHFSQYAPRVSLVILVIGTLLLKFYSRRWERKDKD